MNAQVLLPQSSSSRSTSPALTPWERSILLLAGLGFAVCLRLVVAGGAGARSVSAGAVFSTVLLTLVLATGGRPTLPAGRHVLWGLIGAVILLAVPVWLRATGVVTPVDLTGVLFLPWLLVVGAVAVTEEFLLRGVLFTALEESAGALVAVGVTAVTFALLHVPLYGVGVLPLDLAVGIWFGVLRVVSGGVAAPAIAHALADIAAWWLV